MADISALIEGLLPIVAEMPDDTKRAKVLDLLSKAVVREPRSGIIGAQGAMAENLAKIKANLAMGLGAQKGEQAVTMVNLKAALAEQAKQQEIARAESERRIADQSRVRTNMQAAIDSQIKAIESGAGNSRTTIRMIHGLPEEILSAPEKQAKIVDVNAAVQSRMRVVADQAKAAATARVQENVAASRMARLRAAGLAPEATLESAMTAPKPEFEAAFSRAQANASRSSFLKKGIGGLVAAGILAAIGKKMFGGGEQGADPAMQQAMMQMLVPRGGQGDEGKESLNVGRQILNLNRVANLVKTLQQMSSVSQASQPMGIA